ncbi:DUF4129 domain-containing protein [Halocatena halophila]|uniref:DUF4129 domain-containing protein n=1 Tax=Halocatena halophila TaxID=2814576 RepID=UPI002ECFE86D
MSVNRDRLRAIGLAALLALTIAAAGATVQQPATPGSPGEGDGTSSEQVMAQNNESLTFDVSNTVLDELLGAVFGLLLIVGLCLLAITLYREGLRSLLGPVAIAIVAVVVVGVLLLFGGSSSLTRPTPAPGSTATTPGGTGGVGGGSGSATVLPEPLLVAGVVLAVVVGALVFILYGTDRFGSLTIPTPSGQSATAPTESTITGTPDEQPVAEYSPETPSENAITEAWRSMATQLSLPLETTTPREFAEAAIEAGMDPAAVETLTDLFEATRYGTESATSAREQRAIDAHRRIDGDDPERNGD